MAKRYRRNNDTEIDLLIILAIGAVGQFYVVVINFIQGNARTFLIEIDLIIILFAIKCLNRIMYTSKKLIVILKLTKIPVFKLHSIS